MWDPPIWRTPGRRPIQPTEVRGKEGTFDPLMSKRLVDRKAVIPLVSTIPVLACAFAFSLGPAPEKRVLNFYAEEPAQAAALEPYRAKVVPFLLADLPNKGLAHRLEVIRFVGQGHHPEAVPLLGRIATDGTETAEIRQEAKTAVEHLIDASARAGL